MNLQQTQKSIGNVDIYVIDQILKGRYQINEHILDAGCGEGRNLKWFYKNDYTITGIDMDPNRIQAAKQFYPKSAENFSQGNLDDLPYSEDSFDHVLCCAVLHFAKSEAHFNLMFSELIRVLKREGTLLIRVASDIGLDNNAPIIKDGGSHIVGNFYLTRNKIEIILKEYPLEILEPIKTTNVQDIRAMTTLVLKKT